MALADLLVTPTTTELEQDILDDLAAQSPPLPVTAWQDDNPLKVTAAVVGSSRSNLYQAQYNIASGGFLSLATGSWLTLLAYEIYGVSRTASVATRGLVQLTDAGGGPHTIVAGTTTVASGSRTYLATAGATLPLNSKIFVPIRATELGIGGNVANGAITTLVTALVGTTVTNPIPWISRIGTAALETQGYVRLTSVGGGLVGAGACSVTDGAGHTYSTVYAVTLAAGTPTEVLVQATAVGTGYNLGNSTITTVSVDPLGDLTVSNPAPSINVTSWITTAGSEEQSDTSLRQACRDVLLSRGISWTEAGIRLLATQTVTTSGTVITRTKAAPSGTIAGQIDVSIAGDAGAVLAGDVADVQTVLNNARSLGSTPVVSSASNLGITITGTVSVPVAYLVQAQTTANLNLAALAAGTPIGGDVNAGYAVQLEDLIAAIKAPSYNSSGTNTNPGSPTAINLTAPAGDTALGATQVPVFTVNLTWTGV